MLLEAARKMQLSPRCVVFVTGYDDAFDPMASAAAELGMVCVRIGECATREHHTASDNSTSTATGRHTTQSAWLWSRPLSTHLSGRHITREAVIRDTAVLLPRYAGAQRCAPGVC